MKIKIFFDKEMVTTNSGVVTDTRCNCLNVLNCRGIRRLIGLHLRMELDENLVKLQGTLYSFGMRGLLNNPDKLQNVVEELQEIIKNFPDDAKSKITFFMVLSTGFPILEKLTYDANVGHCITPTPYFEKEYLVTYIYHLNLHQELNNIIENCQSALGLEILDVVISKLKDPKFHQDQFGNEHFYKLWKSVFVKLCKLDTGLTTVKFENGASEFFDKFTDIFDLIKGILKTLMNVKELEGLLGSHLYNFFKIFLFFIQLHKSPKVCDDPLYQFSTSLNSFETHASKVFMKRCINKIFNEIPSILMHLTVDMWMCFSECYLDSDPKNSIQLVIGDLVFEILKEVKHGKTKLYDVPSDTLSILSSIAVDKSNLISKAEIGEIISNVNNKEKEWFGALVRHPAFFEEKSIECLINHLELASPEDLEVILNTSYDFLCNNEHEQNTLLVKKLFLNALKMVTDYSKWLEKIFEKYQPNILTTAETNEELIETFNKISKDKEISDCNLILLCMQSPLNTIKRLCHLAIYGADQMEFVIKIFKSLEKACKVPFSEDFTLLDHILLKSVLEELTDKEEKSFINLFIELGKVDLLGPKIFIRLLNRLKEYLENELSEKAICCLKILEAALVLKIFHVDKAVLLVFLSQVLGHFSWDLKSYSIVKAEGRDVAGRIVNSVMNSLGKEEDVFNFQWAQNEISKSWEVNQACFCDLWFKFNSTWSGTGNFHSCILALAYSHERSEELKKFLCDFGEPNEVRISIILSLTMLLPVLTFREWNLIFGQLTRVWKDFSTEEHSFSGVLDLFGTSLEVLVSNSKDEKDIWSCVRYCIRNLSKLTKECCPKMTEKSLLESFEKIFVLIGIIDDEEERKCCWEAFSPVLVEIVERLKKKNCLKAHKREIEELLPFLDLENVAEVLLKKLN